MQTFQHSLTESSKLTLEVVTPVSEIVFGFQLGSIYQPDFESIYYICVRYVPTTLQGQDDGPTPICFSVFPSENKL